MYKDKAKQQEAVKRAVDKHRGITKGAKGITKGRVLQQGITADGTYFKDGVETMPPVGILPERPRFLTLSDGQILDRCHLPKVTKSLGRLTEARIIDPVRAERYRLWAEGRPSTNPVVEALANPTERAKLRRVCAELTNHHCLGAVAYGAYGTPMDVVAEYLEAF